MEATPPLSEVSGVAMGSTQAWLLPYILTLNLVDDPELATAVFNPTPGNATRFHPMQPPETEAEGNIALARIVASVTPYVYYFILVISAGYMMQSVTAEKENRVVEILLTSAEPRQIMVGKILGMTVMAWVGGVSCAMPVVAIMQLTAMVATTGRKILNPINTASDFA